MAKMKNIDIIFIEFNETIISVITKNQINILANTERGLSA